jgi:hypothetical protein
VVQLGAVSEAEQFIDLHDLYLEYKDSLLPLSLRSFTLFTSTLLPVDSSYRCTLNRLLLDTIISPKAPTAASNVPLTQELLVTSYLSFPAKSNSIIENAKMAILLEGLMRLLLKSGLLTYSVDLEAARAAGEGERRRRATSGKKKDDYAKNFLNAAEARMKIIVTMLKAKEPAS